MTMQFYYTPMSSATRVHWALEEVGAPYEKIKIDLAAGDQKKPEFLALNPNGKIPLLVVDGKPIFESLAILLFLSERFGVEKGLFPAEIAERAEAFKWMAWGSVSIHEAVSRVLRNTSDRFPAEERNAGAGETAKRELGEMLSILDRHLDGKEHMLGAGFSLVDVSLVAYMPFLGRLGVDLNPHKHLNAWVGRGMSRPALGRAMMG